MALKSIVESLDGVPEAARELYAERDGKFHLAVEGMVSKDRLDEFRDNNVALRRQFDEFKARFDGVDPDEFRTLSEQARKTRDKQLIDAGQVDQLVGERTAAMRADHDKVIKTVAGERDALRVQLEGLVIDSALRDAAAKLGVRAGAVEDVLLRGKRVFRLAEGQAVAMDGDKPMYGKGGDPMGVAEWVGSLVSDAPHLFEQSSGSGARSGSGTGGNTGRISKTDAKGFLANIEKIAAGKMVVGA